MPRGTPPHGDSTGELREPHTPAPDARRAATPAASPAPPSPPQGKKAKADYMPGQALGFPMYHALTGNLPVLTKELHTPAEGGVAAATGPDGEGDLQPGWVPLLDPATHKVFWWNLHYRSRREERPAPTDDGKRGAGRGERNSSAMAAVRRAKMRAVAEGKTWEEKYDLLNSRCYYWNRKANVTQWEKPASFYEDGVGYRSVWREEGEGYRNRNTGEVREDIPDDYDGLPR